MLDITIATLKFHFMDCQVGYVTVPWTTQESTGQSILSHGTVGWFGQWDMSQCSGTHKESTGRSISSHGTVGCCGQWDMSQCSGTHRSPLDIPSCPMVQWDGTDSGICHSAVGHIGVHWTFHLVPWYSRTVRTVGYVTVQWDI